MSEELKDFQTAPTLTLNPFAEEEKAQPEVKKEEPLMDENVLSEEERKMADQFANQIDLTNSAMILQYGAGTQSKMADFSETALENVKTKDLGEVGELLGNAILDKMYELNLTYFKELTMYILAGKKKLEEVQEGQLKELLTKAQASGLAEDAQAARDLEAMCGRFEKKVHDLELTRMISIQTAPQIRLVQNNDTVMVEKIQSTIVNTIPLWKSQMVLALGVAHSAQAAAAQRKVTDMTNELLKKNADTLKMATLETARESERGIVDMETLKATNESLISTLDEVMQKEGKNVRKQRQRCSVWKMN